MTINSWVAILSLLLVLASSIVVSSMFAGNVEATVDANSRDIAIIKVDQVECENRIAVMETHYQHIKESLDRIEAKVEGLQ